MHSIPYSGIKLVEETEGEGSVAQKGDKVEFESQGFLNKGECIQERMSATTRIGERQIIAGIEYALIGMKPGGYRKIRISPHLAYRDAGVPDKIPPNAVLIYELWLQRIHEHTLPP
jgi:FKBP-type peptidyl-prolyl cis-trans isomerase